MDRGAAPAAPRSAAAVPEALARLIATAQVPLCLSRRDGRDQPLVAVNDAFERLSGYGRSELIGRDCRLLQGPRTQAAARAALRRAIDAEAEGQAVLVNHRRGGEAFDNFVFLLPVRVGGAVPFYLASQFEVAGRDRTRLFERHGGFLMGAVAELNAGADGACAIGDAELQQLDRGAIVRRRLDNWASTP